MTRLEVSFSDPGALAAFVDQQLVKGMVFLPDAGGVEPLTSCSLVVSMHGRSVTLRAEIVYVREDGAGKGVGLQLEPPDAASLHALRALADPSVSREPGPLEPPLPTLAPTAALPMPELPMPELPMPELPMPELSMPDRDAATSTASATTASATTASATTSSATTASASLSDASDDELDDDDDHAARAPQLHERMRSLTSAEQQRLAATGSLQERTMLERLYGPNVWEALLTSGRLSPPEVARIAKKGTVPRTLLELIGANGSWLSSPLVQRALLSNPRCPTQVVTRALQALPRRDLQLVPQQTAYPPQVRQAAKTMLGR
jgi:hypothetical protein